MKKYNPQKFYDLMYVDCEGYVEIRQLTPIINQHWVRPKEVMKRVNKLHSGDIYFGCATRKEGIGTKKGIMEVSFLWADIDFKDTPEADAIKLLKESPFQPTITIRSGGGLHPYFKLKEPFLIEKPEDIDLIERVLKKLASFLKADMAATDITRILRVPGTLNNKYNPPRDAYISYFSGRDGKC